MAYSWPVTQAEARAEIKDKSNSADAVQLQGFIDAATTIVEDLVGAVIDGDPITEWVDGGYDSITVRRQPLAAVTQLVEYAGTTGHQLTEQPLDGSVHALDGYGFVVDYDTGVIRRTSGGLPWYFLAGIRNLKVVYTAGRPAVLANVRLAALEIIRHSWQKSQQGGRRSVDADLVVVGAYAIPNAAAEWLRPHLLTPGIG